MMIDVMFLDSGREPKCKPDPKYPDGKPINLATGPMVKTCTMNLPFPAPEMRPLCHPLPEMRFHGDADGCRAPG